MLSHQFHIISNTRTVHIILVETAAKSDESYLSLVINLANKFAATTTSSNRRMLEFKQHHV